MQGPAEGLDVGAEGVNGVVAEPFEAGNGQLVDAEPGCHLRLTHARGAAKGAQGCVRWILEKFVIPTLLCPISQGTVGVHFWEGLGGVQGEGFWK